MSRTLRIIALSWVMLCVANAHAADQDGNWWRGLDRSARLYTLTGFMEGMKLGRDFAIWPALDAKLEKCSVPGYAGFDNRWSQFIAGKTNVQIADGLTSFYDDYRNRSIPMSLAVWVVLNEISGTDAATIQTITENLRRSASPAPTPK